MGFRCHRRKNTIYLIVCLFITFQLMNVIYTAWRYKIDRNNMEKLDLYCNDLLEGNESAIEALKYWNFDPFPMEKSLSESNDRCATINSLFKFRKTPLSQEEKEYPLAYGILVYKDITQVLFMLSSFYHPQNEYCIAVSGSADPVFKEIIQSLDGCFTNIHIMERPPISWGSFEIINSTYACFEFLSKSETKWKYYQYLSGTSIPLRTNLEMVKIFKVFNETPNVKFIRYLPERVLEKNLSDSPLPLFGAQLSAMIPRETANYIVQSEETQKLLKFLENTEIADESFWGTLIGNSKKFPVPGAIEAQEFLDFVDKHPELKKLALESPYRFNSTNMNYYTSRYVLWREKECKGKMKSGSCVFGLKDIATVIKQPHFVAHKLYIDFEPAAYFCALKEISRRSLNPVPFETRFYAQLPLVELKRGVAYENITNPAALIEL